MIIFPYCEVNLIELLIKFIKIYLILRLSEKIIKSFESFVGGNILIDFKFAWIDINFIISSITSERLKFPNTNFNFLFFI